VGRIDGPRIVRLVQFVLRKFCSRLEKDSKLLVKHLEQNFRSSERDMMVRTWTFKRPRRVESVSSLLVEKWMSFLERCFVVFSGRLRWFRIANDCEHKYGGCMNPQATWNRDRAGVGVWYY
jgi:hypothetical protein